MAKASRRRGRSVRKRRSKTAAPVSKAAPTPSRPTTGPVKTGSIAAKEGHRELHFNKRWTYIGTALAVGGIVATLLVALWQHNDSRNPPSLPKTTVEAFNPAGPATVNPGNPRWSAAECARGSAASNRSEAMTCVILIGVLLDPCFAAAEPATVVCPSPGDIEHSTPPEVFDVVKMHEFVDGPSVESKPIATVEAEDRPWAVRLAGTDTWCKLTGWFDPRELGLAFGSDVYVCERQRAVMLSAGAQAFFEKTDRRALIGFKDDKITVLLTSVTRSDGLWGAQKFTAGEATTRPVDIDKVLY